MEYPGIDDITMLKNQVVGNIEIVWYKDNQQQFGVEVRKLSPTLETMKNWYFEDSSVGEAFSFYWFDYVVKRAMQHRDGQMPKGSIMNMDSNDVKTMLVGILKNL